LFQQLRRWIQVIVQNKRITLQITNRQLSGKNNMADSKKQAAEDIKPCRYARYNK